MSSFNSPVKKYRRDYGEGHNMIHDASADSIIADADEKLTSEEIQPCHPNQDDENTVISKPTWPVALYVPNLMGYLRILLSFYGLIFALQDNVSGAMNAWTVASLLDLFDGIAARKLNQCSKFGVLLDILADNFVRTMIWITAIAENVKHNNEGIICKVCCWTALICLEWITMVCSQCSQANSESGHWKDFQRGRTAPFWVEAIFKNNFKNIFGSIAIYGLFVAPFASYVWAADRVSKTSWPWIIIQDSEFAALILLKSAYIGRLLCVGVEFWLCSEYIRGLIHHDVASKQKIF